MEKVPDREVLMEPAGSQAHDRFFVNLIGKRHSRIKSRDGR